MLRRSRCAVHLACLALLASAIPACGRVESSEVSNVGAAGLPTQPAGATGTGGTGAAGVGGTAGTGGGGTGGTETEVSCAEGVGPDTVCDGSTCDRAMFAGLSFGGKVTIAGHNLLLPASPLPADAEGRRGTCEDKVEGPARVFAIRPLQDGFVSAHLVQSTYDESTGTIGNETGFDSVLYAARGCDTGSMLVCSDNHAVIDGVGSLGGGETLSWQASANTTYYLTVQGRENTSAGAFKLELWLSHGTCFNPVPFPLDRTLSSDSPRRAYVQLRGDTTGQGDDAQASCASTGAPDLVYDLGSTTSSSPSAPDKMGWAMAGGSIGSAPDVSLSLTRASSCNLGSDPDGTQVCSGLNSGVDVSSGSSRFLWIDGWNGEGGQGGASGSGGGDGGGNLTEGPFFVEITN